MIAPAGSSPAFTSQPSRTDRHSMAREKAIHDAGLVGRFNAGDEAAFVEIVSRHKDMVFSVAFALMKNHADTEEVTQDTFVRAHRALAAFRGDCSLATWLHHIALNLARNRCRYFSRRHQSATFSLDSSFSNENRASFSDLVATDAPGAEREAVAGEFSELIRVCMERLGPRARQVLDLRNKRNHSYDEIATELGITTGTVKSRIARARESLRALLAESCPEFAPDSRPGAWLDHGRSTGGVERIYA